ncbi:unnamed protein product [Symbiodinium sp. CCMP2592]|nr:unnamed protein product [Symbiodinium sp. CCMP2592]
MVASAIELAAAFGAGAVFSWFSSSAWATSTCPACQVSCGSLTCPVVHCSTGHIEIGPITGAFLFVLAVAAYILLSWRSRAAIAEQKGPVQKTPLGPQPLGLLAPGSFVLVKYNVPEDLWHARLLLAPVSGSSWVILTPQADLYIEDLGNANTDISGWRAYDPSGPVPYGLLGHQIHRFRVLPDAAAITRLCAEGEAHAQVERARLGLSAGTPAHAAPPGGQIANLAGPGAGQSALGGAAQAAPADNGAGHAGLAAALGGGIGAHFAVEPEDARTLSISRDDSGLRFKEFRMAVSESKVVEFPDWPIGGPRTAKHVITQMLDHGGSALQHHQAWRVACKFQPSDGPAMEHEAWCKVLHTFMTYDQVDVTNLAGAELIVRAIQRIEERHKWKLAAAEDSGEGALFMGANAGSRVGSIVSPKLTEWIGTEMQREALVAKERRKAREERRNIFPLPEIPWEESAGPSESWRLYANEGIKALNDLAGCVNSEHHMRKKSTRAQRRVLSLISDAYLHADANQTPDATGDGIRGLCSSSRLYNNGRSDVQPYARENISWPEVKSSPENVPVTPYVDPVLKNNVAEYCGFLDELIQRNMVGFQLAEVCESRLGIFFVRKKSGQLRLLFDTRRLNQLFVDPPTTDLPSADAFTRLEMPENKTFMIASGDLANAFYTLSIPDDLARMFTLPAIEAGRLGITSVDGNACGTKTLIVPYLKVLPMGWNWALHICQQVLLNAIDHAGFDGSQIVGDKRGAVEVRHDTDLAVAGYVDNFGVFGVNADSVNSGLRRICDILRGWGLTVHEVEVAQQQCDFVGLHFDGQTGFVSIKTSRLLKIKSAIEELLRLQVCTGRTLQLILGHCTWALMGRRQGLALLRASYAFVHQNLSCASRLWESVRKELQWIAALLPLFRFKINTGWSSDVVASDSSPWGVGVCHRQLDVGQVRSIGSCSERWRFKFEDALQARERALQERTKPGQPEELISCVPHSTGKNNSFITSLGFEEVPHDIMLRKHWCVAWSKPWEHEANILHTEARALTWSVEHLLRANRCIQKRLLCFSDNLPLVLTATKGRRKSAHLNKQLRKLAALCLATGSKVHVRWVPSEINPADAPSRAFQQWKELQLVHWWDDLRLEQLLRDDEPSTLTDYTNRLKAFAAWLGEDPLLIMTVHLLDNLLIGYLEELFDMGKGIDSGIRIVAAIKFFHPHVGKGTLGALPRAARALKGWQLAAPPQQRLPIPAEALGAIIGVLLEMGYAEMCLRLFIQFLCYLRPGECSNLLVKQLVPPQRHALAGNAFGSWAILLHPSEDKIAGKTNIFDASVLLDSDSWMGPLLFGLIAGKRPDSPLWSDSHRSLHNLFTAAIDRLGLTEMGWNLYNLRHCGATHDVLSRRRSLLEVKQRGRWAADSSLKRYVKQARLQSELARIPQAIRDRGAAIIRTLPDLLKAKALKFGGSSCGTTQSPAGSNKKVKLARVGQSI